MSLMGKRVRYIREDTEDDKRKGYYPPIGTLGTVFHEDRKLIEVHWDTGTRGDGNWWCENKDVELVEGEE